MSSLQRPWLSNWPRDVPQSVNYPEISLSGILHKSAVTAPNRAAILYHGTRIPYRRLDALADRFGGALQDLGVKKGDRVAIYLPNIPQFVIAYYAALRAGAVVVAVSPLYKERELAQILIDSGAEVLVAWDRLYSYVQPVKDRTKLRHVITTSIRDYLPPIPRIFSHLKGIESYPCPIAYDMKTFLAEHDIGLSPADIQPKVDVALLQYTGGTTGTPKGAMLTHYNLVVNAAQFAGWLQMKPAKEVHLCALPFFHIYGMTVAMNAPVYTSTTMVLIPDPRDTHSLLRAIDKYKPTIFCGTPTMYVGIINQQDIQRYNLRSIRACVSGASGLPVEVQRNFEELTGGRLVEGYGLTETSPVTHVNPLDDPSRNRPGSIGIPVSDTDAKIVDLETGEHVLPSGTPGELVIHGPQVMLGYWNKPDETKTAFKNGWLHTGDIATMDPDGYFRIIDRKKDMINVSGLKVWPREVEEILYEHPAVKEAAIIGVPDQRSGEAVKAFVVLKDEYRGKIASEEITRFCKERIASYKAPRCIEFKDALPKSPVGKVLRRELRTQNTA